LLVRQRTMLSNALRGHLAELGAVSAKGRNGTTEPLPSRRSPFRVADPSHRVAWATSRPDCPASGSSRIVAP
jgi:hypothetical protein